MPAFGALIAEPLYVLADTAVVGHLGTPQLGGLAVASSVLLTGYAVFIFLAYGTTGAVARLIGAGNEREAAHQAVQGMWLAVCIAAVLVPAGLLSGGWLVRALGASGDLATNAEIYLRISMFGVPALLVTLAGTGYLRGRQDTFTPLAVALGSNVVNLVVELVLINGLGFGIGASALATVLAQTGAAAIYVGRIVRAVRTLDVSVRPDGRAIGLLGRAGGALLLRTAALRVRSPRPRRSRRASVPSTWPRTRSRTSCGTSSHSALTRSRSPVRRSSARSSAPAMPTKRTQWGGGCCGSASSPARSSARS